MKVTIVIPNYNGANYLRSCLDSLKIQTFTDYEILMVDNCSQDESINLVEREFPNVLIEKLDQNYGFSKAVNEGIQLARGKYVVLLNSDTVATANWLQQLVDCIEQDHNIFSCASKMLQYHNPTKIDDAGDWYSVLGWAYQEGHGDSKELHNKTKEIFSSCAGAAIYKKELFSNVGLFDELFFAYLEDVDIGYRALLQGYKNIYCPDAHIYHIGSATSGGGYNSFKVRLSARNNVYLPYKNMPNLQLLINLPFLLLGFLVKYLFFKRINLADDYLDGFKEGLKTLNKVKRTKWEIRFSFNYVKIEYYLFANTFKYILKKLIK
ncbi:MULTISPECIES: glycosyltransferase family 2 protein [Paenibacillus]|uniref:glycosyltransferase family 2 protein n=1 Tax=Paenibacillus TaxID=44249 RepID=UPI001915C8D7|nr:glycosyltransferase family 2 protein [Paenibacillus sp. EPM92]